MLILKPYPHITIWGGERLNKYIDKNITNIGHLYTVRGTMQDSNEILNRDINDRNLYEYFCNNKDRWGMSQYDEFPISIALVDAKENLSVQVHPNKEIAAKYESVPMGKNESFYLLEEPEVGAMINGCKCNSTEEIMECVEKGEWDNIIDYLYVKKGDYVYVPAGTLHAMTKGALTYEIEENCSYTYRLYDYDRVDAQGNKRELDVDKAISSIDVTKKSVVQRYGKTEIIEERYATQIMLDVNEYKNETSNIVCLTVIEGNGNVEGINISCGSSIILEPDEMVKGVEVKRAIVARVL